MKEATVVPHLHSRFWAVHLGPELLAVTVYKKGARKVADTVNALLAANSLSVFSARFTPGIIL
jgi:hypothetical protein